MTINPDLDNPLYSVNEVAVIFGVSPSTVRGWIKTGKIKGTKVNGLWRVPKTEMVRLANQDYGIPMKETNEA